MQNFFCRVELNLKSIDLSGWQMLGVTFSSVVWQMAQKLPCPPPPPKKKKDGDQGRFGTDFPFQFENFWFIDFLHNEISGLSEGNQDSGNRSDCLRRLRAGRQSHSTE